MAKKELVTKFDDNGRPLCPKCDTNKDFEIVDYNISPEDKKEHGKYQFVAVCKNCKTKITYYRNI